MAQSGWRLSDDLLRRVRVRAAEEGVRQNAWVERALEKALGEPQAGAAQAHDQVDSRTPSGASSSAPPRAPVLARPQGKRVFTPRPKGKS